MVNICAILWVLAMRPRCVGCRWVLVLLSLAKKKTGHRQVFFLDTSVHNGLEL